MSGNAEDLFGDSSDSDDTDELIAGSKGAGKPAAKKKAAPTGKNKRLQKAAGKKKVPNADFDSSEEEDSDFDADKGADDDDDDESKDEAAGLFDSDDSDDGGAKKKSKKLAKKPKKGKKKRKRSGGGDGSGRKLSKRERMEALRAKKRQQGGDAADGPAAGTVPGGDDEEAAAARAKQREEEEGYNSDDSYGSETFVRTKEDDDFIDAEGEDPDALRELYAEQHFDDERGEGTDSEDEGRKKGKKGAKGKKKKKKKSGPDALSDEDLDGDEVPDNPILAAVHKMKKKKKTAKKLSELEDEAKEFLNRMDAAAKDDEAAVAEKRPATRKLAMLPEVVTMLAQKNMTRPLLDLDLLTVVASWVRPLPNGQLGNVTVRSKILKAIGNMGGENGVTASDLKRSSLGKVVMSLYMHKSETPELKRQHKELIERWSRPIFQKSGNMRDLEKVQDRRGGGSGSLAGIARAQAEARSRVSSGPGKSDGTREGGQRQQRDLSAVIALGSDATRDLGTNRVRVPFSKGFQFTARPSDHVGDVRDKRTHAVNVKESREALHKRMLEKSRPVSKNQRSSNISIEGRPTK